jgi:hypothetical protein
MKLPLFFNAMALSLCVFTCSGEDSEHTGLTELLDSILSFEQEHKEIEEKTGFHVLRGFDFYDELSGENVNERNANDGSLLIADSRDGEDMPLPLGWEEVGNLLNEPIQSSLIEHDEFPTCLWLCCLIALIGMSLILTGSGMLCCWEGTVEILFSEKTKSGQESGLPSCFAAPVRTYSNVVTAGLCVGPPTKSRRPSLNLGLS